MRPFAIKLHRSSKSIHDAAGHIADRPSLRLIRRVGAWAFVSIPSDESAECTVHLWYYAATAPDRVARVLGHELGHISDGGPKDSALGRIPEEERADEFALVALEVVRFLFERRIVSRRVASARSARRRARPRRRR